MVCCPEDCPGCYQQDRPECREAVWPASRCCGGDIIATNLSCSSTNAPPCVLGRCETFRPSLPWAWPQVDRSDEPRRTFFKVLLVVPLAVSQAAWAEGVSLRESYH